ncbi:MAG: hypothetical protein RJB39_686 [Candidatus Parcubacteria bacterium]|jgi:hypothetical protein
METSPPREYHPYVHFLIGGCLFLFLLLLWNEFAVSYSVYFLYQWLDTPMHFFGGFAVGIFAMGILRWAMTKTQFNSRPQFWYTVGIVVLVGVVWELVETYYKVSVIYGGLYWYDTIKDLLMDTFGGILSYICFHQRTKHPTHQ